MNRPSLPPSLSPSPTTGSRKLLVDLGVVALVAALGALAYFAAPLLAPRTDVTLPTSACDLGSGPCTVDLPAGGSAEISISPQPIPALKPLQIAVTLRGTDADRVEVDFAGVDMQMGYNRPRLTRTGDGRFGGQTSLPVCVTGSMPWQATLMIDTGRGVIAAPFRFDARG